MGKLGWIGHNANNEFMVKNTQGSYMTFETKQAFNIKIRNGASLNRAINFIFDNDAKDGTVRMYNDRHYSTNGVYSPEEDNIKVGIALHRSEYPEERLDVSRRHVSGLRKLVRAL